MLLLKSRGACCLLCPVLVLSVRGVEGGKCGTCHTFWRVHTDDIDSFAASRIAVSMEILKISPSSTEVSFLQLQSVGN